MTRLLGVLMVCVALLSGARVDAQQGQCDAVTGIQFPVDTAQFVLVQDFAVASYRHHGRFHTGEDWAGGGVGLPVQAIANGRVTLAGNNIWGRDGGVVIIEHVMPDGGTLYSQYAHVQDVLPAVGACVQMGDVIASVTDARPAPHLHFEIKTNNPTNAGAGYVWDAPTTLGYLRPSQVIYNWQTRLSRPHQWFVSLTSAQSPVASPVVLDDHSLIVMDGARVIRITADGRVLWRVVLDRPAVGLVAGEPMRGSVAQIVFADGAFQPLDLDGNLLERWTIGRGLASAPMLAGSLWLFYGDDAALIAVDGAARQVQWTAANVPQMARWAASAALFGVVSASDEVLIFALSDGALLDRALVRDGATLHGERDGSLWVTTQSGVWRVARGDGEMWSLIAEMPPQSLRSRAAARGIDGSVYVFDGAVMTAYTPDRAVAWQVSLPAIDGLTALTVDRNRLFLTGDHGHILALQASSGALCGVVRTWGDDHARLWHHVGADGVLRVGVAGQIFALDWSGFLAACA